MSFKRLYLYYQPEDLTWLTNHDMRATWIEQAKHAADELRGILVHIDCGTKYGKWLGYDQFARRVEVCGPGSGLGPHSRSDPSLVQGHTTH